jgi:hypothetical protein
MSFTRHQTAATVHPHQDVEAEAGDGADAGDSAAADVAAGEALAARTYKRIPP